MKNGADIQLENGNFARIHNAILEHIAVCDFTAYEFRCLLFLLRKTYGWGKPKDDLSYSQWADGTQIPRRSVMRSLASLVEKNVIVATENGANRAKTWGFNKYIETWKIDPTSVTGDTSLDISTSVVLDTSLDPTSVTSDTSTSDIPDTSLPPTSVTSDTTTSVTGDTHKRYKKITTTTEPSPSSCVSDSQPTLADVFKAYENNIGILSPMLSDTIKDDADTYPTQWLLDAMQIAVERERRSWRYVSGILKNWQREGKNDTRRHELVAVSGEVNIPW